jgi:predicted dehydrogenase
LRTVNLGIIGLGNQGKLLLNSCHYIEGVNVMAVADTSDRSLKYAEQFGIKTVYKNYEDLLKNSKIDAVIIGLPNFLHYECAVKTAEAKKDMLLEKPLARNVEEGKGIVSSAEKNGVKLMLGYVLRFDPFVKDLKTKISDGLFGDIQTAEGAVISNGPFTARADKVGPTPVPNWWFDKQSVGGGALLDLGIHMIDIFTWFFGEATTVSSYLNYKLKLDVEDTAICTIKFKDGPIAVVRAGWFSKTMHQSICVNGTAGNFSKVMSARSKSSFILNDFKKFLHMKTISPALEELKYFADCLLNDSDPSPSGKEGLRDLEIISKAYETTATVT